MTKKFRTYAVSSALIATMSLSFPATALAWGIGGGGMPSDAATNSKLEEGFSDIGADLKDAIETLELQTGQLGGNLKETLASTANMNQLMDERQRQREIEKQKFEALKNSAVTQKKCVILSRAARSNVFNRPDQRLSAETLQTLEQLASWNLGTPLGSTTTPNPARSPAEKAEMEMKVQADQYCDPGMVANGLCAAPVEPELQGATYVAGKSIFSSDNYSREEIGQACAPYVMNVLGESSVGLNNTSTAQTVDSAEQQRAMYSDQARKSLAARAILDYCMDRDPFSNQNDSSQQRVIDTAASIAGYDQAELEATGMSYMLGMQIRSQEWLSKLDNDQEYTDVQLLERVALTVGWMAHQNNEIYKKIDKLNVLQAATLAAANESVTIQRQQLDALTN